MIPIQRQDTQTTCQKLIEAASHHPRDLSVVLLCLDAGLFLGEVTTLQVRNIDFENRELHIKGKRPRNLAMTPELAEALQSCLSIRGNLPATVPVITTLKGKTKGLADRSVEALLKKLSNDAGLDPAVNARWLRQCYAEALFEAGLSRQACKERLGISDDATLNKYRIEHVQETVQETPEFQSPFESVNSECTGEYRSVHVPKERTQRSAKPVVLKRLLAGAVIGGVIGLVWSYLRDR